MTKHRKREEWIEDILEAAACEIDTTGYPKLTMDAIAARSGLSKGGVYRFFANKREIALALFTQVYRNFLERNVAGDEVVDWNLSVPETITKLLFLGETYESIGRNQRVWIQLLPEAIRDEQFQLERTRLLDEVQREIAILIDRLFERDSLQPPAGFESHLEAATLMGISLVEGLMIQGSTGTPMEQQVRLAKGFVQTVFNDVVGADANDN
jgi:AcrR family transcriptional regulator